MSLFTTDSSVQLSKEKSIKNRIDQLKDAVQNAHPGICTDRALLWTSYYKNPNNRKKPAGIQIAEALREVLLKKKITIYPNELIVGNFSSKRVGGSLFPELHDGRDLNGF